MFLVGLLYIFFLINSPFILAATAGLWKVFEKSGYKGWEAIIPVHNCIVLLSIIGKPRWWCAMLFIPIVNIVFFAWVCHFLSKSFGKSTGFTIGLVIFGFLFLPILGFGSAEYEGPFGDPVAFREYRDQYKRGFDFERSELV